MVFAFSELKFDEVFVLMRMASDPILVNDLTIEPDFHRVVAANAK